MAEVVGAAFLGLVKYVKEQHGPDYIREVVEKAGKATQEVFSRRIIILSWYSYESFVGFLRALDSKLGRGDLTFCRELGRIGAERDIETIYNLYQKEGDPQRIVRDCGIIWKRYYRDAGRIEAVSWEPENTMIRILDFPEMDVAHCRLMEGWMTDMLRGVGAKLDVDVKETKCMSKEDPYHEFACAWRI